MAGKEIEMRNFFKAQFSEKFTLMAWVTLLSYIWFCTAVDIKTDSVRDAWNILILIAGFIWGSAAKQTKKPAEPEPITEPKNENHEAN